MRLSMSRELSSGWKSGFRVVIDPTRASATAPPRPGSFVACFTTEEASIWQAPRSSKLIKERAAPALTRALSRAMSRNPDIADADDEEGNDQHPGGPVDLPFQTASRPVTAAQPSVAATDRAAQTRRLRRLQQHACHQEHADHHLGDHQGTSQLVHFNDPGE